MNEYSGLIEKISKEYCIKRASGEKEEAWKLRVIYSALGQTGLASLWDRKEDGEPISITHFKRSVERVLTAYVDMFPEIVNEFAANSEDLINEIYTLYSEMGYIYHSPNRISPCVAKTASNSGIRFERGLGMGQSHSVSGLCEYVIDNSDADVLSVIKMFHINKLNLYDFWNAISQNISWTDIKVSNKVEYLRVKPSFSKGYWKNIPEEDGSISLMRMGEPGARLYYLYRYEDRKLVGSALPGWMVEGANYRKIANSLLSIKGVLPPIRIEKLDEIVNIRFDYLPDKDIHMFIKAYSWPEYYYDSPCDFSRTMTLCVWNSIEKILEYLGYSVEE